MSTAIGSDVSELSTRPNTPAVAAAPTNTAMTREIGRTLWTLEPSEPSVEELHNRNHGTWTRSQPRGGRAAAPGRVCVDC